MGERPTTKSSLSVLGQPTAAEIKMNVLRFKQSNTESNTCMKQLIIEGLAAVFLTLVGYAALVVLFSL
jgi:hypothetical protein